jgi:hypothetical protein
LEKRLWAALAVLRQKVQQRQTQQPLLVGQQALRQQLWEAPQQALVAQR